MFTIVKLREDLDKALVVYENHDPILKAEVYSLLGIVCSKQLKWTQAIYYYNKAAKISSETKTSLVCLIYSYVVCIMTVVVTIMQAADVEMNLADICRDQGSYKRALKHLQKSLEMWEHVQESDTVELSPIALCYAKMALCHLYNKNDKKADEAAQEALLMTSTLPWTQNTGNQVYQCHLVHIADSMFL